MYTIHKCCGDAFDIHARQGWAKLLSRIMDVIIPVVVNFEMNNVDATVESMEKRCTFINEMDSPTANNNNNNEKEMCCLDPHSTRKSQSTANC